MKILLNNVAKIKTAEIELLGITVIGGENSTGKSTVGKALYAVYNSSSGVGIIDNKKTSIQKALLKLAFEFKKFNTEVFSIASKLTNTIIDSWQKDKNVDAVPDAIRELVSFIREDKDNEKSVNEDNIKQSIKLIQTILELDDVDIRKDQTQQYLTQGFHDQVNHISLENSATIQLAARGLEKKVEIQDKKIVHFEDALEVDSGAIYIDSLESLTSRGIEEISMDLFGHHLMIHYNPNASLRSLLKDSKQQQDPLIRLAHEKRLESITRKLDPICKGSLKSSDSGVEYSMDGSTEPLHLDNIAAGLKIFLVLQTLLTREILVQGHLLILDEPETHLHPKWQLALAELIVLIQKEYDMRILVTTHSPYFLRSIEVFSKRHHVEEKCRYYLAEIEEGLASTSDVTGNIEAIYEKLAAPLQDLKNICYEDDLSC